MGVLYFHLIKSNHFWYNAYKVLLYPQNYKNIYLNFNVLINLFFDIYITTITKSLVFHFHEKF